MRRPFCFESPALEFQKQGPCGEKREGAFALQRVADRLSGAVLALLLQAGFLFLLFQSVHLLTAHPRAARELTLILPRLTPAPVAPAAPRQATIPVIAVPRTGEKPAPPPALAPDAGALRGFGQSLFGCDPGNYPNMTPDQRSHCLKPGEHVERSEEDLALNHKSHAKDAALWQEEIDERNWMRSSACVGGGGIVAQCLMESAREEHLRAAEVHARLAREHSKAIAPPLPVPNIPMRRGR